MNGVKGVFASKTVWTAIAGVIAAILIALGILPEGVDATTASAGVLAVVSFLAGLFRIQATEQVVVGGANQVTGT